MEKIRHGDEARESDLMQIGILDGGSWWGAVLSVDGNGAVTRHWPIDGPDAVRLHGGGEMENRLFLGVFFISTASGALFGESLDELSVRRFGLYVASNDGGGGRQRLLYAEDDVNTVSRMMAELGGLAPRTGCVFSNPTPAVWRRPWIVSVNRSHRPGRLDAPKSSSTTPVIPTNRD